LFDNELIYAIFISYLTEQHIINSNGDRYYEAQVFSCTCNSTTG